MTTEVQATLECEVCGAGWAEEGQYIDFSEIPAPYYQAGPIFFADKPPECPECGEADAWDTVE